MPKARPQPSATISFRMYVLVVMAVRKDHVNCDTDFLGGLTNRCYSMQPHSADENWSNRPVNHDIASDIGVPGVDWRAGYWGQDQHFWYLSWSTFEERYGELSYSNYLHANGYLGSVNSARHIFTQLRDAINKGFNISIVSAFGRNTIVSSIGDLGASYFGQNGAIGFDNPTASVFLQEANVGASSSGGSNLVDGASSLASFTSMGYSARAYDTYNSSGWKNKSGRSFYTDLLKRGSNGKYVRGVQGYRNSAKLAKNMSNSLKATGKAIGVLGVGITVVDAFSDGNLTWGDGAKIGIGLITTFTPIGWGYGIVDFGTYVMTGTSLTNRAGNYIDGL